MAKVNVFKKVSLFFKKAISKVKEFSGKFAVEATEELQKALKNGTADALAQIISATFPKAKDLPQKVVAELKIIVPKVLAAELALKELPENPTEKDIKKFADAVLKAFNVENNNSKLWTTFGAQIYGILEQDKKRTFASLVRDIEEAYQLYKDIVKKEKEETTTTTEG